MHPTQNSTAFTPPGLYALVVNWNLLTETAACIDSLLNAGLDPERVILVDNGSTDGSPEVLRQRYRNIRLVRSPENLGYAGGVNLGVAHAIAGGAEWIFLVNNDAVIDADFFKSLAKHLVRGSGNELYGPAIYYSDPPDRVWFFGDRLVPGTLFTRSLYKNRPLPEDLPERIAVDFLNGCGMVVPAALFRRIGGFDTALFMYGEEVDFCWRARAAGGRFFSIPAAKMWHSISRSAGRDSRRQRFLQSRNQVWFYRRRGAGLFQRVVMFAGSFIRAVGITAGQVFRGRLDATGALWAGWRDGWWGDLPEPQVEIGTGVD